MLVLPKKGLGFEKYIQPTPILLPNNILEDFTKPLSLSYRLFGNILGDELVVVLIFFSTFNSSYTYHVSWIIHKCHVSSSYFCNFRCGLCRGIHGRINASHEPWCLQAEPWNRKGRSHISHGQNYWHYKQRSVSNYRYLLIRIKRIYKAEQTIIESSLWAILWNLRRE